ncbi:hypothetical protein [Clostridium felsineum]|uniref:Uncharacterized protein n=1 Tax=Clostridium felsineum TaxID=36839 RepID=A0A1S8MEY9_9CLOT|nr:hypothetical protein [Clostridium felsineum]URZ09243.1 hypothetical protein CLROS_046590 [Clostridium felsineum]URZ13929.1 hypothetical protein CROST_047070 [Clostridium felsineum]
MATVEYVVFYKYVHPTTKKPVTNLTSSVYDTDTRFLKAFDSLTNISENKDILDAESSSNEKYDMFFIYDGILEINQALIPKLTEGPATPAIYCEKFQRCKGEAWFIASYHASLQAALNAAEPLVLALGKENVKVMKNAPLDVLVELG